MVLIFTRLQVNNYIGCLGGQQRQQGTIKRASQEQHKLLSQYASSPRWHGKGSTTPCNLLSRKPAYNSNFGRFFEVTSNDYQQLQEINVGVAYVEINQVITTVPLFTYCKCVLYIIYIFFKRDSNNIANFIGSYDGAALQF